MTTKSPSSVVFVPRILRLQAEIGAMFVDHMDLLSLTRWRLSCKANYAQSTGALRRSLLHVLRPFVPFPSTLLDIVTRFRGIFGGEVALAFILRDRRYTTSTLEIFASEFDFCRLCDAILANTPIRDRIVDHSYTSSTHFFALRRLIAQTLTISLTNGKTIHVHRSYTTSASAPLTRTPCTALSNFVTAYSFGCSHPLLTLNRRALLADEELRFLSPIDAASMNNLLFHKFSMAVSPAAWSEYRIAKSDASPGALLSEPSSPLYPVSTLKGFVAADVDLESGYAGYASNDDDFAFNVGLARAVYGEAAVVGYDVEADDAEKDQVPSQTEDGLVTVVAQFNPPITHLGEHGSAIEDGISSVDTAHLHTSLEATGSREYGELADVTAYPRVGAVRETRGVTSSSDCESATDPADGHVLEGTDDTLNNSHPSLSDVEASTGHGAPFYRGPGGPSHAHFPAEGGDDVGTAILTTPTTSSSPFPRLVDIAPLVPPDVFHLAPDTDAVAHTVPDVGPDGDGDITWDDATSVNSDVRPSTDDVVVRCWRHLYICPSQGRYFGDRGSFVDFMDPLAGSEDLCVENNIAPYGAMVVWRIMSTFDCEEGCEYFDNVLEEGVTSIPVMFKQDPYGELRDIVSDRYMPVSRGERLGGRPRSSSL